MQKYDTCLSISCTISPAFIFVQVFPGFLIGAYWKARPVAGLALSVKKKKKEKRKKKRKKGVKKIHAKRKELYERNTKIAQ